MAGGLAALAARALCVLAALPALAGGAGGAGVGGGAGPAFAPRQATSVLAAAGQAATLDCRLLRLGDKSVSWVRSRDLQILSHAGVVFTADARVSATEGGGARAGGAGGAGGGTHRLRIERLRAADSGRYECQVNTDPKLSLFFNLTVLEEPAPVVRVAALGGAAVRGARGGAATLACEARYWPDGALAQARGPPALAWTRAGGEPAAPRGGVSVDSERWGARVVSRLTLHALAADDAGLYECRAAAPAPPDDADVPDGAPAPQYAAAITLLLDDEDGAEAMQRDQSPASAAPPAPRAPLALLLALAALLR